LIGNPFFIFHLHRLERDLRKRRRQKPLSLPPLEDANAVQLGLMNVLDAITTNSIDNKQASLLLYGLQTAAINLKRVNFEPADLHIWAVNRARAEQARAEDEAAAAAAPEKPETRNEQPAPKPVQHLTKEDLAAAEALFRASGS